jgi:hypothetical protein
VIFPESFLHGMKLAILGKSFDRGDIRTFTGDRQSRARLDGLAIHMHHACAALACIATNVCTGLVQIGSQELYEKCAAFDLTANLLTVYRHGYCRH